MPVWTARCKNQDPGCVSMGAIQRGTSWATIPKTLNRAHTVHAPCAHRATTPPKCAPAPSRPLPVGSWMDFLLSDKPLLCRGGHHSFLYSCKAANVADILAGSGIEWTIWAVPVKPVRTRSHDRFSSIVLVNLLPLRASLLGCIHGINLWYPPLRNDRMAQRPPPGQTATLPCYHFVKLWSCQ